MTLSKITSLPNGQLTNSLQMTDEIADALRNRRPVVALESTVLTHGLPREKRAMSAKFASVFTTWNEHVAANLAAAEGSEAAVRACGAIPATIAVMNGRICVGLTTAQREELAAYTDPLKISLRDLGPAIARQRTGGTTVASTTAIAAQVGISVFATGGIGGVHRGWHQTLDVSADLIAIANNPVLVVSAGAKILLDLPATLEALETLGVPTIGFRTGYLPRFTVAPDRTLALTDQVNDAMEAARIITAHWSVQPSCGILLMQPCPEAFALAAETIEKSLSQALTDAAARGIRGAATTPFLLARLAASTGGESVVEANLALLFANATLAAQVSSALCT